jgi:Family of unknown function (DUF6262)
MRADNSHHLIAAARRRAAATRKRAIAALRRMDKAGTPVTVDALAKQAKVSRSWLYNQPDLRAEVERLRARHNPAPTGRPVPDRQRASDASHYCDDWSPRLSASGAWRRKTSNSAKHWPWPSASTARPPSSATLTTRRERNPPRSSDPANDHVEDTVLVRSPLVKAMIISLAQDNGR